MILKKDDKNSASKVADILRQGGVVIIPTDTVYGFSSIVQVQDSSLSTFCTDAAIRKIKGRSESKPLIQLIANPQDLSFYTDDDIPQSLLKKWPGALTIIVHTKKILHCINFILQLHFGVQMMNGLEKLFLYVKLQFILQVLIVLVVLF